MVFDLTSVCFSLHWIKLVTISVIVFLANNLGEVDVLVVRISDIG